MINLAMKNPPLLSLLLSFLLPLLVGISSINTPFSLTSDGKLVNFSEELSKSNNLKVALTDIQKGGPFQPVFWLTSHIPFTLSPAPNAAIYHGFRILIISLNSTLIFLIIYGLSKSGLSSLTGSLAFTFATSTQSSWNNLRLEDPILIFYLLISLASVTKIYFLTEEHKAHTKRNVLALILVCLTSLTLATFTKQQAVFITPALFLFSVFSVLAIKKATRFVHAVTVIALSQSLISISYLFFAKRLDYNLQQSFIIKNLKEYIDLIQKDTGWFFLISIFLFLVLLIRKSKDLRHETAMFKVFCLFFFSLFICFLLEVSINPDTSKSLLGPTLFPLCLFIGCSLSYLFSIIRRLKKAVLGRMKVLGHFLYIGFILYSLIFFYFQVKEVAKSIEADKEKVSTHSDMVKSLSKNLLDNSKVYFSINSSNFSYATETQTQLKLFYNKDTKIEKLNPYLLPPFKENDIVVSSHQYQDVPDNILDQILSRKILLYNSYLWTIYKIGR